MTVFQRILINTEQWNERVVIPSLAKLHETLIILLIFSSDENETMSVCAQVRAIRKKMVELITNDITGDDLKGVVNKLLPDSIAKDIEKACQGIYPLHDVYIRKVSCATVLILRAIFPKHDETLSSL